MKRSVKVPLLVLGSIVALQGCSPRAEYELKQQKYASKEECLQDWNDEESCSQDIFVDDHNNIHTGGYYGPRYYWDRDLNRPVEMRYDGTTRTLDNARISPIIGSSVGTNISKGTVSRGGFGSYSRGFSGGG